MLFQTIQEWVLIGMGCGQLKLFYHTRKEGKGREKRKGGSGNRKGKRKEKGKGCGRVIREGNGERKGIG